MTQANYQNCLDKTLSYEGGYSDNPQDKGNWTGCEVGVGVLKGTMKGISACAYPNEDIKNLTDERIAGIYYDDYWMKCGGDDCPAGIDLCAFDGTVNSGPGNGVKWLQQAIGMPSDQCDGAYGPITQGCVAEIEDDHVHEIIDDMCDQRMDFLRSLDDWDTFGAGWTSRVNDVRKTAHEMVDMPVMPVPEPEPETQVVSITISIRVPKGIPIEVDVAEG